MADKYKKIGEVLKAARIEQKRELSEIAEATKIMERYLEAIEAGNPSELPSEAYFMLFSKNYAQLLGLDPQLLQEVEMDSQMGRFVESEEYEEEKPAKGEKRKAAKEKDSEGRSFVRPLIYMAVAVIILFAAVLAYNHYFLALNGEASTEPTEQLQAPHSEMPGTQTEVTTAQQPEAIPYEPFQKPEKLKLFLLATQDVWAVVIRDGDTVLNRQLRMGESRSWEADYRYRLTLGISTAVDLRVNGKTLRPLTEEARTVAGLEINQANYMEYIAVDTLNGI
jgi:transcriptional regulator with XRE-family HTH domain